MFSFKVGIETMTQSRNFEYQPMRMGPPPQSAWLLAAVLMMLALIFPMQFVSMDRSPLLVEARIHNE